MRFLPAYGQDNTEESLFLALGSVLQSLLFPPHSCRAGSCSILCTNSTPNTNPVPRSPRGWKALAQLSCLRKSTAVPFWATELYETIGGKKNGDGAERIPGYIKNSLMCLNLKSIPHAWGRRQLSYSFSLPSGQIYAGELTQRLCSFLVRKAAG